MSAFVAGLGLALLAVVLGVAWAIGRARRRRREMEQLAARLGLAYDERVSGLAKKLSGIPSVASAPHQRFSHVMLGADEIVCDWSTLVALQKRRRSKQRTLVALRHDGRRWPSFRIVPRSAHGNRLEQHFAGQVVRFDDPDGFDERYRVEALDESAVRDWLGTARRGALALPEGVIVEGGEEWIVAYRSRRRASADEIVRLRDALRAVGDQLATDFRRETTPPPTPR